MEGLNGFIERVIIAVAAAQPFRRHHHIGQTDEAGLIGYSRGEECRPVSLHPEERRRHLYVLGATGCGKTNLLLRLIESDLRDGRTIVVLDLRGDLVDRVLLRLAAAEDPEAVIKRICLLDLRSSTPSLGFNPLIGPGETQSRAFHLLGVIKEQSESWGVQLEETLRNCLIALSAAGASLLEIERLLTDGAHREEVLAKTDDPFVLSFFDRYGSLSADKQLAWTLPVLNKVTPLLSSPAIRAFLSAPQTIDVRELLDTPGQIVLVSLAVDRLHGGAYLLGGLLVSAIQAAAMARASQPEKTRNPVHLYIDEFETMASPAFEAIVAEGRRFGLSLTLSHQNLSQVPSGLRQVLRNNVHSQLFFQTGAIDAADLALEVTGLGSKEEVRRLLLRQDVGEAILLRRGRPGLAIRTLTAPDPQVSAEALEKLKGATGKVKAVPASKPKPPRKETPTKTKPEVRHGKRPGSL